MIAITCAVFHLTGAAQAVRRRFCKQHRKPSRKAEAFVTPAYKELSISPRSHVIEMVY
jgi:hypothetical protein